MPNSERGEASETLSPYNRIREVEERIVKKEGKAREWGEYRELRREDEARLTGKNLGIALDIVAPLEALTQFAENNPLSIEALDISHLFMEYERDIEDLQAWGKRGEKSHADRFEMEKIHEIVDRIRRDMAKKEEKMRDLAKKLLPPQK